MKTGSSRNSTEVRQLIKDFSKPHTQELCQYLLPNGTRIGNEWRVGSLKGEAGQSLAVSLLGEKAGKWSDFATNEAGCDMIEMWCKIKKVRFADAVKALKKLLGNLPEVPKVKPEEPLQRLATVLSNSVPVNLPFNWSDVSDAATPGFRYDLADWRGYSREFVDWLWKSHYFWNPQWGLRLSSA